MLSIIDHLSTLKATVAVSAEAPPAPNVSCVFSCSFSLLRYRLTA